MKPPEIPPKFDFETVDKKAILELLHDVEANKKLNNIDKGYPYWDRFKYKVRSLSYDPATLWVYNKLSREKSISKIKLSEIGGFSFKYNITSPILKYLHNFDLHLGGVLEGRTIIPPDDRNRYLISSIMEEAIASSQLEGAATTREIAKEMLRTNRKPRTLDERMILNNYLTIKRVLEIKDKKMSKDLILELHSLVSKDTLKDSANEGKFRANNNVQIWDEQSQEVVYTPPNFEHIEKLIESFCKFANNDNEVEFLHPIIRGIILHFLIGYIHPFVDGNGRTGRAIFYWYLISKGYWLVEYMSLSKIIIRAPAQYGKAFLYSENDDNDLTYFIAYNLKSMDLALKNLQFYIQRKIMEKKSLIYHVQNENINERQAELLRSLIIDNQKSFTIAEVQNKFGVVYQTARTDLMGLLSFGYLREKKYGKKLIFFRVNDFDKKIAKVMKKEISEND